MAMNNITTQRDSFTCPPCGCSGTLGQSEIQYSDVVKELEKDLLLSYDERQFLHECSENYLTEFLYSCFFCLKLGIQMVKTIKQGDVLSNEIWLFLN